jgi:hypothetical protein
LDAETWNRCEALRGSEPNPLTPFPLKEHPHPRRGRRSLSRKKAGEGNWVLRRHRGGTENGGRCLLPLRSWARFGWDGNQFGSGDLEPVPASLARSCPRSFRSASFARFGQDDRVGVGRFGRDDGFGCGDSEPVPASLTRSCPRSFCSASFARFGQDDGDWMRRFGTGTGFAGAKLSEVLPLREHCSLRSG